MRRHVIALFVVAAVSAITVRAEPEQESGWCSVSPTRSRAA